MMSDEKIIELIATFVIEAIAIACFWPFVRLNKKEIFFYPDSTGEKSSEIWGKRWVKHLFLMARGKSVSFLFSQKHRLDGADLIFLSFLLNLITQPLFSAWIKDVCIGQDYKWPMFFVIGETIVIAFEALGYYAFLAHKKIRFSFCFTLSLLANGFSLAASFVLPV